MSYDIDDDNSDDYALPPGFQGLKDEPADAHNCPHGRRVWFGNECGVCEGGEELVAVVMGRPVVPNELEIEIGKKMGIDFSDPYDGSVKKACKMCLREVWIGPMQQAKMDELGEGIIMCPEHAVQTMHDVGQHDVINLGHQHERGN